MFGGRWNPVGSPVVYVADSIALAALEILVHVDAASLDVAYVSFELTIPDTLIEVFPARLASLPDVPIAAEAGLPNFQAQGWNALFVPAGTPEPVVAALNSALRKALAGELLKKRYAEIETSASSGEELSPAYVKTFVAEEIARFGKLLK